MTKEEFFELFEPADNQEAADAAEEAWRESPEYAAHKAAEIKRVQQMLEDGVDTGEDMVQHKGESA